MIENFFDAGQRRAQIISNSMSGLYSDLSPKKASKAMSHIKENNKNTSKDDNNEIVDNIKKEENNELLTSKPLEPQNIEKKLEHFMRPPSPDTLKHKPRTQVSSYFTTKVHKNFSVEHVFFYFRPLFKFLYMLVIAITNEIFVY